MEEFTKEEIGVGAAMAAGSLGEKGKIELFVKKVSKSRVHKTPLLLERNERLNSPIGTVPHHTTTSKTKKQSPNRFMRRVSLAELLEEAV